MTKAAEQAKADYAAALAAFRKAQARLTAAKAALKPFLDEEAASTKADRLRNYAAAIQAWLDGATETEAAIIAGYKSPNGFDSARDRMMRRYAPEMYGTAYDESCINGVFSRNKYREIERRHAATALSRYHDTHP